MYVHVQSKKYQERVFSLTLHVLKYLMTFALIFSEHLLKTNTHMRTHPLFRGLQTAKGCCGNNGVCLKKHTTLCRLSLDMELTAICGLKGRAQQLSHFISSLESGSIFPFPCKHNLNKIFIHLRH